MTKGLPLRVYLAALSRRIERLRGKETDPYLPLPEGAILSPYPGHVKEIDQAQAALGFANSNPNDLLLWQHEARQKLSQLMGYPTRRFQPALTVEEPARPIGADLWRQTFCLRVRPETDVIFHLLWQGSLRDRKDWPVFCYLAGSTSGVHVSWGEAKVPIDYQRLSIGSDLARQAAERGYLVVAVEQLGFGAREERTMSKRSSDRLVDAAFHALLLGRTLQGEKCWDMSSILDWLLKGQDLVGVDQNALYLFGHSSGGSTAFFTAALDVRFSGVLCSGSIGRFCDTIGGRAPGNGEIVVPDLINWLEAEDLVALVAPRPFIGLSGTKDHIFPYSGVADTVERARPFYVAVDAGDKLHAIAVDGPHQYYPAESWTAWEHFIRP